MSECSCFMQASIDCALLGRVVCSKATMSIDSCPQSSFFSFAKHIQHLLLNQSTNSNACFLSCLHGPNSISNSTRHVACIAIRLVLILAVLQFKNIQITCQRDPQSHLGKQDFMNKDMKEKERYNGRFYQKSDLFIRYFQ